MFFLRFQNWLATALVILTPGIPSFVRAADGAAPARPTASLEQQAEVYLRTMQLKEQMLADYRTLLEVYYEMKSKSDNPRVFANGAYYAGGTLPPTSEKAAEFASVHYDEFRAALDADPRLKGNVFVAKLKEYGTGQANDVFQRVGVSALEPYESLDRAIYMNLYREVANPIQAVAMLEAGEVYAAASKQFGYDRNGVPSKPDVKKDWLETVEAKERALSPTLIELEKKSRAQNTNTRSRKPRGTKGLSSGAACAADFGKL